METSVSLCYCLFLLYFLGRLLVSIQYPWCAARPTAVGDRAQQLLNWSTWHGFFVGVDWSILCREQERERERETIWEKDPAPPLISDTQGPVPCRFLSVVKDLVHQQEFEYVPAWGWCPSLRVQTANDWTSEVKPSWFCSSWQCRSSDCFLDPLSKIN